MKIFLANPSVIDNKFFKDLIGTDMRIYKITEIFGILVFIICLFYGIIGLYQLIKRKSIKKKL